MILSCQHIHKSFLEKTIMEDVSFNIEEQDKAAIVGINGAGKTTLLRIIVGELPADQGLVTLSKGKTLGYLAQHQLSDSFRTIYEELLSVKEEVIRLEEQLRLLELNMPSANGEELEQMMEDYSRLTHQFETADGYALKSKVTGVLKGLGFSEEDFDKPVPTLSGGQKTRVALGRLLLLEPDLILLDEPTNHLDMNSISWLEVYLQNYRGAVVIVSHDRYFLDRVCNKVVELDNTQSTVFSGNYSDYAVKKEALRAAKWNAYMNQQREIKHQEEVIEKLRSFNREKSIKRAESRQKMLNKINVLDKPAEVRSEMQIRLEPSITSGNDVLHVEELTKSFGSLPLFSGLSFEIKRGECVALIGDNGTGKTTILKLINGLLPPDSGLIRLGANVHIGYYDQEHQVLHPEKTLFEEISDEYPYLNNTQIRTTLAAFLFTGDDVFKRVGELSGGEKGRLSLAKLMLSECNFLILDEPTNHLDIVSKEILEDALNGYTGTILYVSHDRYFINRTASRILDLRSGTLHNYLGGYDYYLEKRAEEKNNSAETASFSGKGNFSGAKGAQTSPADSGHPGSCGGQDDASASSESNAKLYWKASKEEQARIRRKEREIREYEERIDVLEGRSREIDALMLLPDICTDVARLQELSKEKTGLEEELQTLYDKWEALSEEPTP